ncbi:MAG TPA: NUMOD3 domain-containing DNA-binding protein [Patescibacteria group bacterium]|nr:NUMOD3 domain-containing DNA-binding protein [Patescibacteria group bacterium]
MITEESRKRMSESKKGDRNPSKRLEVRKKISNALKIISKEKGFGNWMKGKHLSEETKIKIGLGLKGKRKDKNYEEQYGVEKSNEIKKKLSLAKIGKKQLEESKLKRSLSLKGRIPWNRGLTKESNEIVRMVSEKRKGHIAWNKGIPHKKISNEKNRQSHLGKKLTYETRKKLSNRCLKRLLNRKYKINWIQKMSDGRKIKPNKPEIILKNLIEQNNLSFNYVGDGHIWFRGENHSFNPDFLSKNPKHIIEVFGDYWHNREDAKIRDIERLKTYSKYGYKTLIIWEHELKELSELDIVNKIGGFIASAEL